MSSLKAKDEYLSDNNTSPYRTESHPKQKTTSSGIILDPQPSSNPKDPLNWPLTKKCTIYSIMVFGTFTGISAAVANVLATPIQAEDWAVTGTQAAYSVSAVLAGIIIGPVLLVPLVRIFGVMSCCFWSCILVAVTSIWSALSTGPGAYGSFIASRGVAGLFCGTCQVFISGVIYEVFFLHQRGKALGIYSTLYMIAQVGGPTFSGYIVQYVSWPVCFWWTVGSNFLAAALIFGFGEDVLWDRENDCPVAKGGIPDSWAKRRILLFFPGTHFGFPNWRRSSVDSLKAVVLIGCSPVTVLVGIYSLVSFAWFIMAGVQIPLILSHPVSEGGYGFSPLGTANFYLSAWIGALVGVAYGIAVNDRLPLWLQKRAGGVWKVEYRLYTSWIPGLVVGPVGIGLFGAANQYHLHWAVMALGEVFLVFAAVASVAPSVNYIIEIWKHYPQEVGVALNVWRITFSISVQFFYEPWVEAVGVGWTWGTAAFISLVGFACMVVLMLKGEYLRQFDLWRDRSEVKKTDSVSEN